MTSEALQRLAKFGYRPTTPEPEEDAEPAAQPDPEPEAEPVLEAEPEPAAEPDPEPDPEPEAEPVMDSEPEAEAEPSVEAAPEVAPEPRADGVPEWLRALRREPQVVTPPEAEPEPDLEPEPELEAEPEPELEAAAEPEAQAVEEPLAPETEPEPDSGQDTAVVDLPAVAEMETEEAASAAGGDHEDATGDGGYVLALEGVSRTFSGVAEVFALRDVSMQVAAGDYVSITGPSGSGKSTLMNVLGLLDRPTVGVYRLSGVEAGPLGDKARARLRAAELGFVFQAFHLMPKRTVFENVLLGMAYSGIPKAERRRRVVQVLEQVSMTHRSGFFPSTLSGGERQRVAVARALAKGPSVLLADEPTGNLDASTSAEVLDLFDELNAAGQTVLVVTHDPVVAGRALRRMVMADGRLEEMA
ncbi:MAG: ATP-binding cassette domain-containing protein [Bifidobacteriaceae bacterium]|jgi:putative ABC transport system ATP-binding protein|nr:ATP-binding cassette domain-containing protein [Bifidobacteriaceae bacterium]